MSPEAIYEEAVHQVEGYPCDPVSTYVGTMTHSMKGCVCITEGPMWVKSINRYESTEWKSFLSMMNLRPLGKSGITPDAASNLRFITEESKAWLGQRPPSHPAPWTLYKDMWEGIPNVSDGAYAKNAYLNFEKIQPLVEHMWDMWKRRKNGEKDLLSKMEGINRRIQLRFPGSEYCPISWQMMVTDWDSSPVKMTAILNFRSVEVSRNLLNDLYLFYTYFSHLVCCASSPESIIISRMILIAADAHIIDIEI